LSVAPVVARGVNRTALVVSRASRSILLSCLAFVAAGTIGLTILLRAVNDVAPFWTR